MAPAIVEGMGALAAVTSDSEREPIVEWHECQKAVRQQFEEANWESSGLPPHVFAREGVNELRVEQISPKAYAERLLAFAFDDSSLIIRAAESAVDGKEINTSMATLLKRSKNLLRLAKLDDYRKNTVLNSAFSDHRTNMYDCPEFEGDAILLAENDKKKQRLVWHPKIREFIDLSAQEDRGCPAINFPCTLPNGEVVKLLPYFWDKLVDHMYPDDAIS